MKKPERVSMASSSTLSLPYRNHLGGIVSKPLELLKVYKKMYSSRVDGGIFLDHCMSLIYGLEFLGLFLSVSRNNNFMWRIRDLVFDVNQKLDSLTFHSPMIKLDHVYADLREQMKDVIINPRTNEYDAIFPEIFASEYDFSRSCVFLCETMKVLVSADYKANQISPVMKELEYIRKMLTFLLEPFFGYAGNFRQLNRNTTVTDVLDRAACFIYLSFIGKIDGEMTLSMKNRLSTLIIEETQIMKLYSIFARDSNGTLKNDIYRLLELLKRKNKCYLSTEIGAALEDHFISMEHGLQFLHKILELSRDKYPKQHVRDLVDELKIKLKSLPHNQKDRYLTVNLEYAYGELRKQMQNVDIKPESYDFVTSDNIKGKHRYSRTTKDFLLEEIRKLVTSSCKADKIAPIRNELEVLGNKLTSLKLLMGYATSVCNPLVMKKQEEEIFAAFTTFLDGATCLIYLSIVGKLNEAMLFSLRKDISLLIKEYERKEISFALERAREDDLDSDIEFSISLLRSQEEHHIGIVNEAMLNDHIWSLKQSIEFLNWFLKVYKGRDFEWRIILLVGYVKQTLISLTYKQREKSMKMNVNDAYADLREEMKKVFMKQANYDILFPDSNMISYIRGDTDFLIEKIITLVNCKAYQIAPLNEELQQLRKLLISLKPLDLYNRGLYERVSTIHHKATILIYLSFVGTMDREIALSIRSNISTTIKENDVWEMYIKILNEILPNVDYLDEDLYLLENLMLLMQGNVEFLNDPSSELYYALMDVHTFLSGQSPNVILRKLHLLQPSFRAIVGHSIPVICSCYLEHTEVDISAEVNCVVELIKHIKSQAQEIKLYYFPRVDDLGFLDFFSEHLQDLIKNNEISFKKEIHALHFEVHSLLSLAKETNQEELDKTPWNDMINMAYQAEYIVDLTFLTSHRDLRLISCLCKIIEQLQNIRAEVHDAVTLDLSCLHKSLPAQGVIGKTTQLSNNDAIVGLQEETKNVTKNLLLGKNKLDVMSLVGMAGVGKTTLALTIYNTPSVADHFDILAWCTVSQSYQNRDLFHSILDQVNVSDKTHRSLSDDQELAVLLCKSLKKRRYLIVLDDLWETTLWNYLKRYLPDNGEGSWILITTRNSDVPKQIGSNVNQLHQLSKENSWELFQKKMVAKESLPDGLLRISKGIVENCEGLPLSIVIIAGILCDLERTEEKWNQIAETVSSLVLSDPEGECKAILELSYNHLPCHLRSCFLYLGSFPEDQEISINQLISLWIGEGLVRDTNSYSAEEVAKKYMEDLIAKSLVIPAKERSRGGVKAFRLHDLLRDFCLEKAKEMHFLTVLDYRNQSRPLQDPRRLIIYGPFISDLHFSCHSVRSMILFHRLFASEIEKRVGSCDMVLVQVLKVDAVQSDRFPNISSLIHLRYLALGLLNWRNSVLPSSLNRLQNLQILILRCKYVVEVPDFIWDMEKLRHIDISPSTLFQVDSNRLQNSSFLLENLRYLANACVPWGNSKWLGKLSGLKRLCCVLLSDGLEEYDNLQDDYDVDVDDVTHDDDDLEEDDVLVEDDNLEEEDVDIGDITEVAEDVEDNHFHMPSFNSNLTFLKVRNAADKKQRFFRLCQLPKSLRELTLSNFFLTSNDISNIGRSLPQLEVFKIYSCCVPSGCEWNANDENFPNLKVLKLRDLEISKWIASENSFPSLEQLWVEKCDYLREIPLDFGDLPNLLLLTVRECLPSVDDSAKKIEQCQHEQQNTGIKVHIYPRK